MMDIYITQYNYRSVYLVVINENANVSVYRIEKIKLTTIPLFSSKKNFIGKSKICGMTNFSGVLDNINFDGNTTLLECGDSKYLYISRLEVFELRILDKILDYISLIGNKRTPYVFAVGSMYTFFISTH